MPESGWAPTASGAGRRRCGPLGIGLAALRNAVIGRLALAKHSRISPSVNQAEAKLGASSVACSSRSAAAGKIAP